MKKAILLFFVVLTAQATTAQRIDQLFDSSWKFHKGAVLNGEKMTTDDGHWREVTLPHDWSIEDLPDQSDSVIGPFTTKSIGATATGYTEGGEGWYRKHFQINDKKVKNVFIYFDGVYMNADVWINGHLLGNHPYGYTAFYYNIASYLLPHGENILAVHVRNEGRNSRWYSGSGIYRHVRLILTGSVYIPPWGIRITTPDISEYSASVHIETAVRHEKELQPVKLRTDILDGNGKIVASQEKALALHGDTVRQTLRISRPQTWSPESPYLYRLVTDVLVEGRLIDHVVTPFGIRSIALSSNAGFLLNGKQLELRGGCMHHDNGPLGSAAIDRAEERRVELLKQFGFNAVRTSHNPPSESFLAACDRLGMIVIDEAFDQWERPKNPQDYHLYFDTCWKKDLDAMILRDRNHPSVVFWSIGNEINERADAPGLLLEEKLRNEVKRLDNTRPVTEAICSFWDHPEYHWDTTAAAFALLDVGGYNYQWRQYEPDHQQYPGRVMMGTESVPMEALENWQQVEEHPYVIGDFVWTAMDYLGETGIGHTALDSNTSFAMPFPWFNAWCGDIDLIGGKKPQSYYRDVVWNRSKLEMLVHEPIPQGHKEALSYWGWPDEVPSFTFPGEEGKNLTVHVYTRYDSIRLYLNDTLVGAEKVAPSGITASFEVRYAAGILKAVALQQGRVVDSVTLETAGTPVGIRLTADRMHIHADPNDLAYVTAEVVDAKGRLVPNAATLLHFAVDGNADIVATANADPSGMESFQRPQHHAFQGKCLVIVRPKGKPGRIVLKVTGNGLAPAALPLSLE